MRTQARRAMGMARVAAHLLHGAATMAVVMPFAAPPLRRRIIQRWSRGVLRIFGLQLAVDGTVSERSAGAALLLVGNHISWLDIYAFLCVTEVRFVAKSEVRRWPLIGWFANNLGTIFVERDRPRDAIRVAAEIRTALDAGAIVCIFPEGTTTDGSVVLPFSSVLLNAAVETGTPVQPVSIGYRRPEGGACTRTAFLGETTLVQSMWSLTGGERSIVELSFLAPLAVEGTDRRNLARQAEEAIRERLGHAPRAAIDTAAGHTSAAPEASVIA